MNFEIDSGYKHPQDRAVQLATGWLITWAVILLSLSFL